MVGIALESATESFKILFKFYKILNVLFGLFAEAGLNARKIAPLISWLGLLPCITG